MSNQRFIKFIDSEEADWLREHQPNAFLLLSLIAVRARRISGKPDGLEIGEAKIGDYKKAGIQTRGQYRHALQVLINRNHLLLVETCRTRKKATTGTTTEGSRVKLLKSSIWDINSEDNNHRNNHSTTTEQPPNNHEQERRKKDKKEKEKNTKKEKFSNSEKIPFKEFVFLTEQEHAKLLALHGQQKLATMLDILNSYKGRTGKQYESDYSAMDSGSWVIVEADKRSYQGLNGKHKPAFSEGGNRMYAEEIVKKYYKSGEEIGMDNESIYFLDTVSQQAKPVTIKFRDPKFEELIMHELKKRQFEEIANKKKTG